MLSLQKIYILPNTAGCYTAKEALYTLELAREILDGHNLVSWRYWLTLLHFSQTLLKQLNVQNYFILKDLK